MKVQIGKTYAVSPRWKKSFDEQEHWVNSKGEKITISTLWRSGTINITPQNEDEVSWLLEGLEHSDGESFEPYAFEEYEYQSAWDGCSTDLDFSESMLKSVEDEENCERLEEGYHDEGTMFLEEEGFDVEDSDVFMWGALDIEEL
jgi:hypothetical protein